MKVFIATLWQFVLLKQLRVNPYEWFHYIMYDIRGGGGEEVSARRNILEKRALEII